MTTLNVVYDVEEDRSFVKRRAIALGVMLAAAILFLGAAAALLAGPQIAGAVGLGATGQRRSGRCCSGRSPSPSWSLRSGSSTTSCRTATRRPCKKVLLKAAAAAALLWVLATAAFRFYISNFSSYSETYGFLGAFIVLLLWLYVTGLVVLAGGELASEMEEG